MPSGSFSLSDTIATSDSVAEVVRPWTLEWTSEYGESGYASELATLSDTTATSDSVIPASGVVGYFAKIGYTGFSSGFSSGFGPLSENAATSDSLTPVLGYVQSLTDNAATVTSQLIVAYSFTLSTDTVSTSDTLTSQASAFSATLSDSVATSSTQTSLAASTLSETAATSDTRTSTAVAASSLTDSVATSDSQTPFASASGLVSDVVASSETLTFNASLSLADSVATSEALSAFFSITLVTLTDNATTSDTLSPSESASAVLSDTLSSSDSLIFSGFGTSLSDTNAVIDAPTGSNAATATLSNDTLTGSENLALAATSQSISDSAATSDSTTFITGYSLTLSDTVSSSDSLSAATVSVLGSLSDTPTTSETITPALAALAGLSESATTSDSASSGGYGLPLSDTVNSTENLTATGIGSTSYSDPLFYSETLTFLQGYAGSPNESAATSESLSPVFTVTPIAQSDTVTTSDAINPNVVATATALTDMLSFSDEYNVVTYLNTITDSAATSENLLSAGSAALGLSDNLASGDVYASLSLLDITSTADALTGQSAGFQTFLETLLSGDIIVPTYGFVTSWADSLSTSDAASQVNFGYAVSLSDSPALADLWVNDGVGKALTVNATVIPTGGAVLLEFPGYFPVPPQATSLTISRSVEGSGVWTVIYQGPPVGVFLDVGDGLPKPLDSSTSYLWQATDYSGVTVVGPLTPASTFLNFPDQLTQILIRALQGAINNLAIPPGIQIPQISIRMPMNGWQAMPFIVVNVDLIQQTDVEIGEDVINPTPDNNWTLFANAKRVWRVTIMSQDAEERDFYRDALLAIFRVLKATAFGPLGLDVSHTFQAVSYSSVQEWEGVTPGFYAADLLLEINGVFPAAVLTQYPTILRIESDPTYLSNNFTIDLTPSLN